MRLATYDHDGTVATGIVGGDAVRALAGGVDALTAIGLGPDALRELVAGAGTPVPLSQVRLLPPVAAPTVRDFVAFEEHVEGMRRRAAPDACPAQAWYEVPTFYFSIRTRWSVPTTTWRCPPAASCSTSNSRSPP